MRELPFSYNTTTYLPIFFLDSNGHYEERGANLEAEHKFLLYRKYNRIFDRENSM